MTHWHTLTPEQALSRVESTPEGLDDEEVRRRQARFGANRIDRIESVSALKILLNQFASLVVLLLVAASVLSLLLGDPLDAAAIAVVLLINTAMGFTIEFRARRTMDALLRYEVPTAQVVRAGRTEVVAAELLVPGDVIELEAGESVPADVRLIEGTDVRTNEAPLTGESMPVLKDAIALEDPDTPLAERASMLYSGTTITTGRGTAVAVQTGSETEIGRIGTLISSVEEARTPLEVRLDALGRRLVWVTLAAAGIVTVLGVARGASLGLMVEVGIALAIAAVPEGLPVVATIALAVGLRRMAHRNALVRRLAAVEALGATTVLCTDKTGTLTAGQMTVARVATAQRRVTVTGDGFDPQGEFLVDGTARAEHEPWLARILEACALTSRVSVEAAGGAPIGDPTDAALSVLALKGGVDPDKLRTTLPLTGEIPFSSERMWSASLHAQGDRTTAFVKGSPASVLDRCSKWAGPNGDKPLDEVTRKALEVENAVMAAEGQRVIALASGPNENATDLTMLGLVGILDPPAAGVEEAIRTLRSAGIRIVMITGDQVATAEAIAEGLHMLSPGDETLDGRALSQLSEDDLRARVGSVGVFGRVSPADKVRIVGALQERGEIVAMIGDGVNDAAALKKADIGVAMGSRGTDVAKQIAAIVLTDDRFQTIGAAVEEGRVIFDNIRKFIFYLFSCNVAEVLVLLGASLMGTPLPLLPLQILWLNLVTDTFPALALAFEPAEPRIMERPPHRPEVSILSRGFVYSIVLYSLLITGVTLVAHEWALATGGEARAMTIAFMTLALAQLFHLGTARSRGPVVTPARAFANRWALAAVPLVIGLQVAAVYWPPVSEVLRTVPLGPRDLALVVGLATIPALVGQSIRLYAASRTRANSTT